MARLMVGNPRLSLSMLTSSAIEGAVAGGKRSVRREEQKLPAKRKRTVVDDHLGRVGHEDRVECGADDRGRETREGGDGGVCENRECQQ